MKLAETCVKYPVFTVMLIAFLVTLGAFSYRGLAVDLFPKADPATVNVDVATVVPLKNTVMTVDGLLEIS